MALAPKSKSQTATPGTLSQARWLEEVREVFRKACHSNTRMLRDCEAKAMAKGVAYALQSEEDHWKRYAVVLEMSKNHPSEDEKMAAQRLFERRQEARDKLTERLGKTKSMTWDQFYNHHTSSRRIEYLASLMVELGIMKARP